jgi:hypothetical protein
VSDILDLGNGYVNVEGLIVNKRMYSIMEKVKEYDEKLEVVYVDPARADFGDAPYLICERCPDGLLRKVFEVWDFNESVLERIYNADNRKVDVLARLDKNNDKIRMNEKCRYEEERAEAADLFKYLIKNPKTTYTLPNSEGDIITVDDQHGVTKVNGQSVEG